QKIRRTRPTTGGRHRFRHPELPCTSTHTPRGLVAASSGLTRSSTTTLSNYQRVGVPIAADAKGHEIHRQRSVRLTASVNCCAVWMTAFAKLSETRPGSSYIATLRLLRAAAIRFACSRNADGSAGKAKRAP